MQPHHKKMMINSWNQMAYIVHVFDQIIFQDVVVQVYP